MSLADLFHNHRFIDSGFQAVCACNWVSGPIGYSAGRTAHADHLQDVVLAAFPALADMLPEADCQDCGEWKQKDHMFPTLEGDLICGECADRAVAS